MTDYASTGRIGSPSGKGLLGYDVGTGYPVSNQTIVVPLSANDAAGQVANWTNPFPFPCIIQSLAFTIDTVSAGACTLQAGVAANAQTASAGLISSADAQVLGTKSPSAGALFAATTTARTVGVGEAVTVSMQTGATAGLAGWMVLSVTPLGIVRNS